MFLIPPTLPSVKLGPRKELPDKVPHFPTEAFRLLEVLPSGPCSMPSRVIKIGRVEDGAQFVVKSVDQQEGLVFASARGDTRDMWHPHISGPRECYQLGEYCFMLRPYAEGIPLRIVYREFQGSDQRAASRLRQLASQLVSCIGYLHSRGTLGM